MTEEDPWHFNKSIPFTLVFAIACQTVALIWFVSSLSSDIESAKKELVRQDTRISTLEVVVQGQAITLARMDENIKAIRDAVDLIATK